jgi:tetratricopeptide (TPR) repeat protein
MTPPLCKLSRLPCRLILAMTAVLAPCARAQGLKLSPEAAALLDRIYSGDSDSAINSARQMEQAQPGQPLPYLLEAEALWWKTYCGACEVKWGYVDAFKRGKKPGDEAYFAVADRGIHLARAQLEKSETAEMHLYLGMGLALKARLYALRGENRNVAHAGVAARSEFLRALELDPQMADAEAGLGLYNYYVDTLSAFVKILRFFMGIPGGNKREGIYQLEAAVHNGALMAVSARFYLAKNLRTYDQQYAPAAALLEPLVARYPQNPVFLLLLGNVYAELGRTEQAAERFRAAQSLAIRDAACSARTREIAGAFLARAP